MTLRDPGLFHCHRPARAQIVRKAFKPRQRSFEAVEQPRRPLLSFSASGSKLRTYAAIAPGAGLAPLSPVVSA
ncbi:hypothetical protein A6024_16405 [Rhodovulum sulfidophilum]|nr:hypothetical protein A6W98_16550 [Rhodovulum sulfidophilum DSM 1374]ANB39353.1 hypothetical protein A6024_16405 [Rhodovulum sulfidophilum]